MCREARETRAAHDRAEEALKPRTIADLAVIVARAHSLTRITERVSVTEAATGQPFRERWRLQCGHTLTTSEHMGVAALNAPLVCDACVRLVMVDTVRAGVFE